MIVVEKWPILLMAYPPLILESAHKINMFILCADSKIRGG